MKNQLPLLAAFCHGGSAVLNILGIVYNVLQVRQGKKDNVKDVLIHSFELAYHVNAVLSHAEDVEKEK